MTSRASDLTSRFGPTALTGVLAAGAAALLGPVLAEPESSWVGIRIPLLAFLLLWAAFELVILYVPVGRDLDNGEEIILTEIPLVLGLLFVAPWELVFAGVAVPTVVGLMQGRKNLTKLLFNAANRAMEIALALTVFQALSPDGPFSVGGWVAATVAVTVSGLFTAWSVVLVITLATAEMPSPSDLLGTLSAVPVSVAAAAVAMALGTAVHDGRWAVGTVLISLVALLLLLHRFSLLAERHTNLASLHRLGRELASKSDVDAILRTSLEASARILVARRATAYLAGPTGGLTMRHLERNADGSFTHSEEAADPLPASVGVIGRRIGVTAATSLNEGYELSLRVSGRATAMRGFRREDARLLDMVVQLTAPQIHTGQLVERLRHDALHDLLTELPNRRSVVDDLDALLARGAEATVLLIGIRDVSTVNEALGHDHADELLRQIAKRLLDEVRPDGAVARLAGDEFAVVIPDVSDITVAREAATAALSPLSRPIDLADIQAVVRASAGIVTVTGGAAQVDANGLLHRAEIALRDAQRTGDDIAVYSSEMESATPGRLALAAELRTGIPRGELELFGQPQVRMSDGVVVGVEALLRWRHPRLGCLRPAAFLELAHQTGLDRPITGWVLNAALDAAAGWREAGLDLTVSVNVPASVLGDQHFAASVKAQLAARHLPGPALVLEMTETDFVENTTVAADQLHRLADQGVRISIDDFGTGFSSLARLRRFPVHEIKVDRSFVAGMLVDLHDAAIVRSVVGLGRDLGLTCVAEGVESAEVYAAVGALGCEVAQGYHLARPMPVAEIAGWVERFASPEPTRLTRPRLWTGRETGTAAG